MKLNRPTALLSLAGLAAVAALATTAPTQTAIDGRGRNAIVFFRNDARGLQGPSGAAALIQTPAASIEGELLNIGTDHVLLDVGNDRLWIPREVVQAVRYDD